MAEAAQEQQQIEPQVPLDMSDEAIIGRAMDTPMPPRDSQGRFVGQQQAQEQAQATPPAEQPATPEQPAEQPAEAAAETPAEQEVVKWDEVKDVKIKVPMKNGEKEWEEELTLHDLREGHMMRKDYLQKTQEVAEQRRQTEALTAQAVEKERGQYLEALTALRTAVQQAATPELANVDWNKLAAENPAEYVRLSNRAREVNEAMQRIRFEEEKVQTQQSKERKERLDRAVSESQKKLKEAIPQWNDDLYQSLLKRSYDTYGFKPDEMSEVYDDRIWRIVHDAHQWRATQEGKPLAEKKVVNVPQVLRPGNAKPKVDPKTQELNKARQQLSANGNDMDAAAALMSQFIGKR